MNINASNENINISYNLTKIIRQKNVADNNVKIYRMTNYCFF